MTFQDELTFFAKAGRGGDGAVCWLHLKYKEFSGPSGGNGGRGGDVYVSAVRDVSILGKLIHTKRYAAEAGEPGGNNSMHGKNGEDLFIPLPIGSIVENKDTGEKFELLVEGQKIKILKGGNGGLGNEHFKGATNQRPTESTPGKEPQSATFYVELQLIADAGLIGLPNAGKSSLLNALTNASARIGAYPFTTLDPNLGVFHSFILADIPGLIEGASQGKGLGHKFLRHIRRTNVLLHCLSLEDDEGGTLEERYLTVRKELELYPGLKEKTELLVLTKTDMVEEATITEAKRTLEKYGRTMYTITVLDDAAIKNFADALSAYLTGLQHVQ